MRIGIRCFLLCLLISFNLQAEHVAAQVLIRKADATAGEVSRLAVTPFSGSSIAVVVTAVRNGEGNLQLIVWGDVGDTGITRKGDAVAGAISEVAISDYTKGVVTAVRNGQGNLQLIAWEISPDGQITRGGDAAAGAVSTIALPYQFNTNLATAVRNGSGNLQVIAWKVNPTQIVRQVDAAAGAVSVIAATIYNGETFITAVVNGQGNLQLIAWSVSGSKIVRKGDANAGSVVVLQKFSDHTRYRGNNIRFNPTNCGQNIFCNTTRPGTLSRPRPNNGTNSTSNTLPVIKSNLAGG